MTTVLATAMAVLLATALPHGLGARTAEAQEQSDVTFFLRYAHGGGAAHEQFRYGRGGDIPIAGDWNGNSRSTIGLVRGGVFHLRNGPGGGPADLKFRYGRSGDTPIAGDWNGNGRTTVGIVRDGVFYLRNSNSGGPADVTFRYGRPGDIPIAGDWNGNGRTTVGIVRDGVFYLRNSNNGGPASLTFRYGRAGDFPIEGDWNGDRRTTVGVVRGNTFYLRNHNSGGGANHSFRYGRADDTPLAGDWNANGVSTVGVVRHTPLDTRDTRLRCDGNAWVNADRAVVDYVRKPRNLDRSRPGGQDANGLREALLNANRYALGTHYHAWYAHREQDVYADVLNDRSHWEFSIRLPASTALSVAIALRTGAYDPGVVGRSSGFARNYATWLTRSVACQHKSITTGGWGDTWQSAFWAYLAGMAGWLLWDDLSADDRFYVTRMVEYEANRFLDYKVPYWTDRNGTIRFPGDSKAEENSWNANVLQLATAMMPNHPNWSAWQHKNVELMLSSYAIPSDVERDDVVNGQSLSAWLGGWNAYEDGTLVNHGRVNPDYMTTIHQNWASALVYGLADRPTPEAAFHNGTHVYRALNQVRFEVANGFFEPGGTIYQPGSPVVYFPQGFSWGPNRPAPYLNLDVMATAFGVMAGDGAINPRDWERLRVAEQLRLQNRPAFGDGRTYVEPRPAEDRYLGREEYVAQILAFAWLSKYVAEHAPLQLDRSDYSRPEPPEDDRLEALSEPPPPEGEGPLSP